MLRNFIVRQIRRCLAWSGLTVTAVLLVAVLAMKTPAYYAELRAQDSHEGARAAATQQLESMRREVERWLSRSLAAQQVQLAAASAGGVPTTATGPYDPAQTVYTVTVTQQQLNTQLAGRAGGSGQLLQNPRLRIGPDWLEFGVEARGSRAGAVISVVLVPQVTADAKLRLDVTGVRLGVLPVPLQALLKLLPRDVVFSDGELTCDLTWPHPHVTLQLPRRGAAQVTVKSVRLTPGAVVVELLPPLRRGQPSGPPASAVASLQQN